MKIENKKKPYLLFLPIALLIVFSTIFNYKTGLYTIPSQIMLFEIHSDSYIVWKRLGVNGRILVHIDGHPDIKGIDEEAFQKILDAGTKDIEDLVADPYEFQEEKVKPLNFANYVYPAMRSDMIRQVYWVVPDKKLEKDSVLEYESLLRKLLGQSLSFGTPSLSFQKGMLRGRLFSKEIVICTLKDLPRFKEPVLLDVDMDYFTTYKGAMANVLEIPKMWPEEVLRLITKKQIPLEIVTIAYSVQGGYTPLEYRYLGKLFFNLVKAPIHKQRTLRSWASLMKKGDILRVNKLYDRAVKYYNTCIILMPENPGPYYSLGLCYEAEDMKNEAEDMFKRAAEIDPEYGNRFLYNAETAMINKDYNLAALNFKRFINIADNKFLLFSHFRLGWCQEKIGDFLKAESEYRKALEINPELLAAHNNLGNCLAQLGKLKEARLQFEIAQRLDPDYPGSYNNLGTYFAKEKRFDEAVIQYAIALKKSPYFMECLINLGNLYAEKGRYKESCDNFEKVIQIDPLNMDVHLKLGKLYNIMGLYEKAIFHLEFYFRKNPDDIETRLFLSKVHNSLGMEYGKSFDRRAIDEFKKAIRFNPDYAEAYNNLSVSYAFLSPVRIDLATIYAKKAEELGYKVDKDFQRYLKSKR